MKKALKIILISIISLCLLVIVAGYIALTQIDFNRYKESIVAVVNKSTGRELVIGDIQVKPSFNPIIELKNVSLSNAKWSKTPTMVSADAVGLGFAIIPLLHKNIVIDEFVLQNAVVNLEETSDGKANWNFETSVSPASVQSSFEWSLIKTAEAAELEGVNDTAELLSSLVIKKVALENVKVHYTDKAAKTQNYDIKALTLNENIDENVDFAFDVNDGLYAGKGVLGALSKIDSKNGYPVKADVNVMGIQVAADVLLFDIFNNLGFNGTIHAEKFMGKNSGYNESADVAFKGDLKKAEAEIKSFKIAGNVITGNITAELNTKVPAITAKLNSARFDIAPFMSSQKSAWNISLIKSAQATSLAPQENIPYAALYGVNAKTDASISQIVKGNTVIGNNLNLSAVVNNGNATVKIVKGRLFEGDITANATLNGSGKTLSLNTNISKLKLSQAMNAFDVASNVFNFTEGSDTDVSINLNGRGNTYADVVNSLDGRFVLIVDKSQLHIGNIGLLKGNIISQLFNTLSLTKGNDNLALSCAVVRSDVKNGVAEFPSGIVLNADKFALVANGDVNLKNDKIDLSIKPFAGKLTDTNIAKLLSSLVKLTGTIQNPSIGIDEKNVVKNIVGVTTTGPVYLGAQMLMESDSSACYTALKGTGYEERFPKPSNAAQSTTDAVGDVINDSVGMVKDTAQGIFNLLSGGSSKSSKNQ